MRERQKEEKDEEAKMLELYRVFGPVEKPKCQRDWLFQRPMHAYVCTRNFFAYFVDYGPMGPGTKQHHTVLLFLHS